MMVSFLAAQHGLLSRPVLEIKGIVHPKMNILSSCTHPHVFPNMYILMLNRHKNIYFEEF